MYYETKWLNLIYSCFCYDYHQPYISCRFVRNVLRIRHISHLRIRAKCYSASSWFVLSHIIVKWCDLADWGYAFGLEVYSIGSSVDNGHHFAPIYPHEGLGDHWTGRLQRIPCHHNLDSFILSNYFSGIENKTRLMCLYFTSLHLRVSLEKTLSFRTVIYFFIN